MRLFQIVAVALLATACGAAGPAGGGPSYGTVTGHVRSYPCAPVEIAGSPCAGRPAAHVEVDFRIGAGAPVRGITDSDGVYAVQLAPGTYSVEPNVLRLIGGAKTVTVTAGKTVSLDFVFDSGIR